MIFCKVTRRLRCKNAFYNIQSVSMRNVPKNKHKVFTYEEAIAITVTILKKIGSQLYKLDVVHEVIAKEKPLTICNLRSSIRELTELHSTYVRHPPHIIDRKSTKQYSAQLPVFKICNKCNDEKPIKCFYKKWKDKEERTSVCSDCMLKANVIYKKSTTKWKSKRVGYNSKYRSKNRSKVNEWGRNKAKRQCAELSDNYIKQVIRQATGIERKNITKTMIKKKKKELIQKRKAKKRRLAYPKC